MSLEFFIFLLYIFIIVFSWIQKQARKSYNLNRDKKTYNNGYIDQNDEENIQEYNAITKETKDMKQKEEIIIDEEVKEFYQQKREKNLTRKPLKMEQGKDILYEESQLVEYLHDNVLIKGIILSEILAPPRVLKPYVFKRYKRSP